MSNKIEQKPIDELTNSEKVLENRRNIGILQQEISTIEVGDSKFYDGTITENVDISTHKPQGPITFRIKDVDGGIHTFQMTEKGELYAENVIGAPETNTQKITFDKDKHIEYIDQDGGKLKTSDIAIWDNYDTQIGALRFNSRDIAVESGDLPNLAQVKSLIQGGGVSIHFKDGVEVENVNWGDKADVTYVNTELSKKSDTTYVDSEIAKKANEAGNVNETNLDALGEQYFAKKYAWDSTGTGKMIADHQDDGIHFKNIDTDIDSMVIKEDEIFTPIPIRGAGNVNDPTSIPNFSQVDGRVSKGIQDALGTAGWDKVWDNNETETIEIKEFDVIIDDTLITDKPGTSPVATSLIYQSSGFGDEVSWELVDENIEVGTAASGIWRLKWDVSSLVYKGEPTTPKYAYIDIEAPLIDGFRKEINRTLIEWGKVSAGAQILPKQEIAVSEVEIFVRKDTSATTPRWILSFTDHFKVDNKETNFQDQKVYIQFIKKNLGASVSGVFKDGVAVDSVNWGDKADVTVLDSKVDKNTTEVAIGKSAGTTNQGSGAISIGEYAGSSNQATGSVAIGAYTGRNNQGSNSIAIGYNTGKTAQGKESIAIGYYAGAENQPQESIHIRSVASPAGSEKVPNTGEIKIEAAKTVFEAKPDGIYLNGKKVEGGSGGGSDVDLSDYYTKAEIDAKLDNKIQIGDGSEHNVLYLVS